MQISKDVALVSAGLPKLALRLEGTCQQEAQLMRTFLRALADGVFEERERLDLVAHTKTLIAAAEDVLRGLEPVADAPVMPGCSER